MTSLIVFSCMSSMCQMPELHGGFPKAMFETESEMQLGDSKDGGNPQDEGETMASCFKTFTAAIQEDENDEAQLVIVSEPQRSSFSMGGLHPKASLYERPVNLELSRQHHANFRKILRSYGTQVLTVRGILAYGLEKYMTYRMELEDLALNALTYVLHPAYKFEDLTESQQYALSDHYKREVLEEMSSSQLIDILMVNPTVELRPTERNTGLEAKYEYQPLSNLVYTRDQQITTAKGIVMGRFQTIQRSREVELMTYCFKKIGLSVLGAICDPGYLEGGDFFPAGLDLCFIGIGLRSNLEGCQQLMDQDWLGTPTVAIVKDVFDQHQDRMHLDCIFNIIGSKTCLMLEDIMGDASPLKRLVDVYVRDPTTGRYHCQSTDMEFSTYVRSQGFNIIPITFEDQLRYGCNVLNLGNGRLISSDAKSSRQIIRSEHFKGTIQAIDYSSITSMYGAVHCSTQVLKRQRQKDRDHDLLEN